MAETAPQPTQPKTSSGLAIAGLVLGIIAILTSFLPIINNLSFFIALIGLVLAVIALVGAIRGKHTAKGMSIAGVVLAVVSIAVVLVTQSAYSAALKSASDELSSGSESSASSTASKSGDESDEKAGDKADDEAAEEEAAETAEESAADEAEPAAEQSDSKYAVTIDSARVGTDYGDDPCIFITYTFTNVSDEDASSFITSVHPEVYQDGVQCETAFADTDGGGNSMTKVKQGSSIEVVCAYELQNATSDVDVEVKELFSWDDVKLATRTFQIA